MGNENKGKYMNAKVVWFDNQPAVIINGERGGTTVIVADPIVRVLKGFDARLLAKAPTLQYKGNEYPLKRAVRGFLRMGRTFGRTKGAVRALKAASS